MTEISDDGLRRELTQLDAVMINIGSIIGSGIFLVPSVVASIVPDTGWILALWVVGGAVSLAGALTIAELGASMPKAGGQYAYLRNIYGPMTGFLYGWACFTVIMSASIAAVAVGCATYIGYFFPLTPWGIKLTAIGTIVLLTFIHAFGVKIGALLQNGFTFVKLAVIIAFAGAGLFLASGSGTGSVTPSILPTFPAILGPFGLALIAILWSYDGWIEITFVGSEVRQPQKNLPKALVRSTLVMIAVYVLVTLAYHAILPIETIAASHLVASDAAGVLIGPAAGSVVALAVLISMLGANNGFVFTAARIYYAMAREGMFLKAFGKVDSSTGAPVHALVGQGIWASLLVLSGSFESLTSYVVFASWVFYALSCVGVMILRRRNPGAARPYSVPGYPFTPIVFIGFSFYLVANAVVSSPLEAAIGALLIASGIPAFYLISRRNS